MAIIDTLVRFRSMLKIKYIFTLLVLCSFQWVSGQVTGGQFAFDYLTLPNSPHVSSLGGISVADPDNDISLVMQNPSMMRPGLHNELSLNYNNFYGGINIMNLEYGYHMPKLNTSFFMSVQYLNYGTFTQTDDQGNTLGDFHAVDYALTVGAARSYMEHWRYGADIKFAHSDLASSIATAAVIDVGVNYYDTSTLWDFGIVAKNMGSEITRYNVSNPLEPLPFDLQFGISKRFKHLPLRLFATLHHLYEWDIRYDNPTDDVNTNILGSTDTSKSSGSNFSDKLFRHFIFGAELNMGKRLLLTISYNDLRRKEMVITTKPGAAGFAFGVGLNLNKLQVHYARTYYSIAGAYNEIGLTMALDKFISLSNKNSEKMHWKNTYTDWD